MGGRINFTSCDPEVCKMLSGDEVTLKIWAIERPGGNHGSPHLHTFTAEVVKVDRANRVPACPACNDNDWEGDNR